MSDYKQAVRDAIYKAVEREIPIFEAANMVESIIAAELSGKNA